MKIKEIKKIIKNSIFSEWGVHLIIVNGNFPKSIDENIRLTYPIVFIRELYKLLKDIKEVHYLVISLEQYVFIDRKLCPKELSDIEKLIYNTLPAGVRLIIDTIEYNVDELKDQAQYLTLLIE